MLKVEYSPQSLEDLKLLPALGVNLGKIIDIPTDYRYFFVGKNYVFYRLEPERVLIVRILNEKRNYLQHLFGISSNSDEEDKECNDSD